MTIVGIVGVGFLGECLAEGLAAAGTPLILSPRNAKRVARLAERHGCTVAKNNAEVVENADLVFLSTRPPDIAATASGLPWREGQRAISIAAGIGLKKLRAAVAPALAIRAMPIEACRIGQCPTAFCPDDALAATILQKFGTGHPFDDEKQFEIAAVFGAYYALSYAFIGEAANWAERNGLQPFAARNLAARMVQAAAAVVVEGGGQDPRKFLDNLMTPGGITEEGLKVLEDTGALSHWSDALEASLGKAREIDRDERRR